MHMADALLSPSVGGAMWAASAGAIAYSSRRLTKDPDNRRAPLMGVLGAFVFAVQMINFTIPATGSSGHLGGGMLLAVLLGPAAGFLTLASVLIIQALFFADGGLLALGANIFNLGFIPCFVVYPLLYRRLAPRCAAGGGITLAVLISSVAALQIGSFGVVVQTVLSGIAELPFAAFAALMQPIHLAIGIVEGLATAAVIGFLWKTRPEFLEPAGQARIPANGAMKKILAGFLAAAALTGTVVVWFASPEPDGLEWSVAQVQGREGLERPGSGLHQYLAGLQEKIALLPDYGFRQTASPSTGAAESQESASWPAINAGATASGIVGGLLTLAMIGLIGFGLKRRAGST